MRSRIGPIDDPISCYTCAYTFETGDACQEAYVVREVPNGLRRIYPHETYLELVFVHLKCPSLGELARRAAERDYEKRVAPDSSPDATNVRDGSAEAMRFVHSNCDE